MPEDSDQDVMSRINDLYKQAADGESKYDPESYHWDVLRQWRKENVKYMCIKDIQGYTFKAEDEQGYFKHYVRDCNKFFTRKINDSRN